MTATALRFDNQVVVITCAGSGVGRDCAVFFASRGASVIINDEDVKLADATVNLVRSNGGMATADYHSLAHGDKLIEQALKTYGSVHILINSTTCSPPQRTEFQNLADKDWDSAQKIHVFGIYKTSKAAWLYFKKQKYGRIVNIISSAGPSEESGHASHAAAEFSLVGFTETLAKEGVKNNMLTNAIIARASDNRYSGLVTSLTALLAHNDVGVKGVVFEVSAGTIQRLQWERSQARGFKTDKSLTASAVLNQWGSIGDFSISDSNPDGPWDAMEMLGQSKLLPPSKQGGRVDFKGKVAIVTGAGNGLGRAYALQLAELGARVVVNDLAKPEATVNEIRALGGLAVPDSHSVEDGDKIIETALKAFGGVHILINNAGILRDKAFQSMTDELWNKIQNVHLRGSYKTARAAWPIFLKQKYGRIVNTTSVSGIYGNFGQSNYASAKCGTIGLSGALSKEGKQHNIRVNTVAPSAGTQLTRTIMPEEIVQSLKPDFVAPFVVALLSDNLSNSAMNGLYEIGSGYIAMDRLRTVATHNFQTTKQLLPEGLLSTATYLAKRRPGTHQLWPTTPALPAASGGVDYLTRIEEKKLEKRIGKVYSYGSKELILYNLGLGAKATDLKWVYEDAPRFEVLPSFGVIPYFDPSTANQLEYILPNFSLKRLLHGEQYLEIRKFPIPTTGELVTYPTLVEVVDKTKAAVVINAYRTVEKSTGEDVFYNEETLFVGGSGGFGGQKKASDRGAATAANQPPPRKPDFSIVEKTSPDAAALYRLSGDFNPLHIDPEVSKVGGFEIPILHGLCSFGIAAKHIYSTFGPFRNIKARFVGTVLPGQTLQTDMWKVDKKVIFQVRVVETEKSALVAAAVELLIEAAHL